ncbi:MAG: hypothetical protein U0T81_18875 [Saprospiraceae bacterium]
MFFLGPIYYVLIHNRLPLIKEEGFRKRKKDFGSTMSYMRTDHGTLFFAGLEKVSPHSWHDTFHVFCDRHMVFIFSINMNMPIRNGVTNGNIFMLRSRGSSYYKLALLNWFTGNIAIIRIHHLNPTMPNYNLKKSMNAILWINKYTSEISIWQSFQIGE